MMTKNSGNAVPRALREVWEWKDIVSQEMAEWTTGEALKRIHADAEALCREYGIPRAIADGRKLRVAEDRASYGEDGDCGES